MSLVSADNITYRRDSELSVGQFAALLSKTSLGSRRPLEDADCLQGMLDHADLTITAWAGEQLVGIARSVTDFHYACYLSDLAVDEAFQHHGIGVMLQRLTQQALGPKCTLILLAAPQAKDYYKHIGYDAHPRCWVLPRDRAPG